MESDHWALDPEFQGLMEDIKDLMRYTSRLTRLPCRYLRPVRRPWRLPLQTC